MNLCVWHDWKTLRFEDWRFSCVGRAYLHVWMNAFFGLSVRSVGAYRWFFEDLVGSVSISKQVTCSKSAGTSS